MSLLVELLVSALFVILTVAIHDRGLAYLQRLTDFGSELGRSNPRDRRIGWLRVAIVLLLFFLHGVEIWIYAAFFHYVGPIADLRQALYFSTITYAAIGFSDQALNNQWLMVAAVEGINGILLIGWSVAFFVMMMRSLKRPPAFPR